MSLGGGRARKRLSGDDQDANEVGFVDGLGTPINPGSCGGAPRKMTVKEGGTGINEFKMDPALLKEGGWA